jgi:pimeloyl-ACP methyl ester carboxylesterase
MFLMIIPTTAIILTTTTTTNPVYGQPDQTSFKNVTDSSNIQSIPAKKIQVGDIDIAYKMLGRGKPILLISGASSDMNAWKSSTLGNLSSNHTVIVFDTRGIGNTTTGSKPYTIQQLANDTAGLLDALKIQKADVLGYSLGSHVAQQLTVTHPDKVNRLILIAATCGGKESIPKSPKDITFMSELVNKSLNEIPINTEDIKKLLSIPMGSAWMKSHPNFLDTVPEAKDLFSGVPPNTMKQQSKAGTDWEATDWSGICDDLTELSNPTLIITGTHDNNVPIANALILAEKIPGAWLVQIKDAGHVLFAQYPDIVNRVLETFLSTTAQSN